MTDKIKILFLAANPTDINQSIRLDKEVRDIDSRIQLGSYRDCFEIVQAMALRTGDLQTALLRHRPNIVHFSGHGNKAGIMLEDESGNSKPVSKRALTELFSQYRDTVRMVVLNACHSRYQIDTFAQTIDYTISMNAAVHDTSAIVFSSFFYQALAFGEGVHSAFEKGRTQILVDDLPNFKTPVLLVRSGVHPNQPLYQSQSQQQTGDSTRQPTSEPDYQGRNVVIGDGGVAGDHATVNHTFYKR